MAVEKRRLLYEFYILSTKNSPTRSEELVEEIGVSVRTFKSDIEDLKQFAIASGARLESKNGVGYWLEVVDHSIFDPVKEQLDISFNVINCIKTNIKLFFNWIKDRMIDNFQPIPNTIFAF